MAVFYFVLTLCVMFIGGVIGESAHYKYDEVVQKDQTTDRAIHEVKTIYEIVGMLQGDNKGMNEVTPQKMSQMGLPADDFFVSVGPLTISNPYHGSVTIKTVPASSVSGISDNGASQTPSGYDVIITMKDVPDWACFDLASHDMGMPVSVNGSEYDPKGSEKGGAPENCGQPNSCTNTVSWIKVWPGDLAPNQTAKSGDGD